MLILPWCSLRNDSKGVQAIDTDIALLYEQLDLGPDIASNDEFLKQSSGSWFELRNKQQSSFNERVLKKKDDKPKSKELENALQHRTEKEPNAAVTLTSTVPFYYPKSTFCDVGNF